jgi:CHAD domain-containing protein
MKTVLPANLAAHLAATVRKTRRRYRKRLAACQKKFSETAVHDLRVETRRALALLDLLEALPCRRRLKKMRKAFKQRLDAFDELRDTQVQLRLLKPLWKKFPEAAGLKKILREAEGDLIAQLRREIGKMKFAGLNRRLKKLEGEFAGAKADTIPDHDPSFAVLRAAFADAVRLRGLVRRDHTETIHRLRIAFKRFRYMSELLEPLPPRLTEARLADLRKFQAAAGDIQDLEVLLARLQILAGEPKSQPEKFTKLRAELLRRRRESVNSFLADVDVLFEFAPERAAEPKRN